MKCKYCKTFIIPKGPNICNNPLSQYLYYDIELLSELCIIQWLNILKWLNTLEVQNSGTALRGVTLGNIILDPLNSILALDPNSFLIGN